jgi:ubiquitin C-terminal hydrolase
LTGVKEFCADVKDESRSAMLSSFRDILHSRDQGHEEGMRQATKSFRLMAGCLLRNDFLDEERQQDAQELVVLFLERVHQELPPSQSVSLIDKHFSTTVQVKEDCT